MEEKAEMGARSQFRPFLEYAMPPGRSSGTRGYRIGH